MNEPWESRSSDKRTAESKVIFYLFCEDAVVEPSYFRRFQSEKVQISFPDGSCWELGSQARGSGHAHSNVDCATSFLRREELLSSDGSRTLFQADDSIQVWCVFDRDQFENDEAQRLAFDHSILNAENIGIKVAWSNDAFELWVLLHFGEVNFSDASFTHRKSYYDALTRLLAGLPDLQDEEMKIFRNEKFSYKETMKSRANFQLVLKRMEGKTRLAIERARALDQFPAATPPHQKAPCTQVHKLIQAILAAGGKPL